MYCCLLQYGVCTHSPTHPSDNSQNIIIGARHRVQLYVAIPLALAAHCSSDLISRSGVWMRLANNFRQYQHPQPVGQCGIAAMVRRRPFVCPSLIRSSRRLIYVIASLIHFKSNPTQPNPTQPNPRFNDFTISRGCN
jgi:hypothetical protein